MILQTEFQFELPKGFADKDGTLHKKGVMRLANAADEILPMRDPRVQANPAYLSIILLSRVISRLGDLEDINPGIVEKLFVSDLEYLQTFYRQINGDGTLMTEIKCPGCGKTFKKELTEPGE